MAKESKMTDECRVGLAEDLLLRHQAYQSWLMDHKGKKQIMK
jgi:hypothetical protein